jgi:hypothetical protein
MAGDPEVLQALEAVQQALRDERSALGTLPQEHAELGARLEALQQEREQLHRELEDLRQGRPSHFPRLPEVLAPPFDIRSGMYTPRRLLRELMPSVMLVGCLLFMPWDEEKTHFLAVVIMVGSLVMSGFALTAWRQRPRWRFGERAMEIRGEDAPAYPVPYSEVLDAEAHVTPSQRKRGVGNVVVKCAPGTGELTGKTLTLKSVPEPERLARWLHDRRGRKA